MGNNSEVVYTDVEEVCEHVYEFVSFIDGDVVERCALCSEERTIEV